MATGEADVSIFTYGNSYRYNAITHETVPFISLDWYNYWRDSLQYVCPLPKRIASYYNILTPLSPLSWCMVSITLLATSGAFIVINKIYQKGKHCPSGWNWYEIILLTFSILFAEAFPSAWKGKTRIFLSTVWITSSMFIVFIYLCNLRSHLVMGIQEIPPKSFEDLLQTKYSHRLHFLPQVLRLPHFKQLATQGRFVPTAHLSFGNVLKGILNQGDCSVNTMEKLMSFEWKNQILDKKRYLYTFAYDIGISEIVSSMQLKSDPYRPIFREKMSHMEENGLMGRMFLQLKPMKPMESEKLKALELEHFYFVFIGISVGLAASLLATICEICHAKCQEKITK